MNTLIFLAVITCSPMPGGGQLCVDSSTGKAFVIVPVPGGKNLG